MFICYYVFIHYYLFLSGVTICQSPPEPKNPSQKHTWKHTCSAFTWLSRNCLLSSFVYINKKCRFLFFPSTSSLTPLEPTMNPTWLGKLILLLQNAALSFRSLWIKESTKWINVNANAIETTLKFYWFVNKENEWLMAMCS